MVGIATNRPNEGKRGHSTDIAYIHMAEWSKQDAAHIEGIQKELGYFKNTKWPN